MQLDDYKDIIHRCFRCGYCKFTGDFSHLGYNCPSYNKSRLETYSPGGRMWLIRAVMTGEIERTPHFAEILYACTMCGNCVEECRFKFNEDIMDIITSARMDLVENSLIPTEVRDFFKNIYTSGNPWKEQQAQRGDWAKDIPIPLYDGHEYLLYVGCLGSYDHRVQKMARALGEILLKSEVSFGILGSEEYCDGNEVFRLGEAGLYEYLRDENIKTFAAKGIKKIITLSPHAFNIMKNDYTGSLQGLEVEHYSQTLARLISQGKLTIPEMAGGRKVTYHDPCFLGRWNDIYDEPRKILDAIEGLTLVEMQRIRENAFCCGGGGGNFYTDIIGYGEDAPARIRVREALETGAEVLAVACPACMSMFDDAIKTEGAFDRITLMDISEIIAAAFNGEEL